MLYSLSSRFSASRNVCLLSIFWGELMNAHFAHLAQGRCPVVNNGFPCVWLFSLLNTYIPNIKLFTARFTSKFTDEHEYWNKALKRSRGGVIWYTVKKCSWKDWKSVIFLDKTLGTRDSKIKCYSEQLTSTK